MNSPASRNLDDASGLAALLGAWLFALLAALLGRARRRRAFVPVLASVEGAATVMGGAMARAVAGELRPLLRVRGEPDYEDWVEIRDWVEWVAVPAPWRAGQGHDRSPRPACVPGGVVRPPVRGRGPPSGVFRRLD